MDSVTFIKQFPVRPFSRGEVLLRAGDTADTLLAIQTGFVKVTSVDDSGVERMLWIAGRYDVAPTERLFSLRGELKFFYTAINDGAAYVIPKQQFLAFAKENFSLMEEIARNMSNHYDDLLMRLDSLEKGTIREKIIHALTNLAQRFSAEDDVNLYAVGLKITHQDIADMIGATRETTSIELQRLREAGMVSYDRQKLVIHLKKIHL